MKNLVVGIKILMIACSVWLLPCIIVSCSKASKGLENERFYLYVTGNLKNTRVLLRLNDNLLVAANLTANHDDAWALGMPLSAHESDILTAQVGGIMEKQFSKTFHLSSSQRYILIEVQEKSINFKPLKDEPSFY